MKVKQKYLILKIQKPEQSQSFSVFGGVLNLNVHFHTIFIDGVCYENGHGNEAFYEIVPSHEEVIQLNGILKKCLTSLIEKFDQEGEHHDQSDF